MVAFLRASLAALVLTLATALPVEAASAGVLQCAPYARQISGIEIFGNAGTWWDQAAGRYERGHEPRVGAVLAFSPSRRMRVGHVAMVSKVVGTREVLLTHANWSYRGGIERNVRAIDVSPNNDWSQVRVWYGPMGDVGLSANPAFGFIYANAPAEPASAPIQIAALDRATSGVGGVIGTAN